MAVELKKFEAEYEALEKKASAIFDEAKAINTTFGHFDGLRPEVARGIGERVQELKDQGNAGTTIKDFLGDAEVKKLYQTAQENVAAYKKNFERRQKNVEEAKKLMDEFLDLKGRLEKEAAARKKKIIGKESASAPEMEKLAAAIEPFLMKPPGPMAAPLKMMANAKLKFTEDSRMEKEIDQAISETKEDRKAQMAQEMMQQSLNVRLLTGKLAKIKGLHDEAKKICVESLQALVGAKGDEAKAKLNDAIKKVDEIDEITTPLNKAYKAAGNWVKTDKDGGKIIEILSQMTRLHGESLKGVEAVQSKVK
jgi:hypothetical protein